MTSESPPLPSAHVTPYDRLVWPAATVEQRLRAGTDERELTAYFGAPAYAELAALARAIRPEAVRTGDRVYVIPGMMGSQLGLRRTRPLPDDVLWFDPIDLGAGRVLDLRVTDAAAIVPLGVLLFDHMHIYLRLRAAGYEVVLHDYDWRLGIDLLGTAFAARLRADPSPRIAIVAHSLGGLVARAALAQPDTERVRRLVMLGTPNGGSFAPVQAIRGTYPLVRRIASLDPTRSAEELAAQVYSGFASLYHMLPKAGIDCPLDLLDPASWPGDGPGPDPRLLGSARAWQGRLAAADERFRIIAGSGEETVTGLARAHEEFRYRTTRAGDGTVPLAYARLEGVPTRYATGMRHGDLPKDPSVIAAVCDLLAGERTTGLAAEPPPCAPGEQWVTDAALRTTLLAKLDWARLTPEERGRFLDTLSAPPQPPPPGTAAPAGAPAASAGGMPRA